MIRFPTSVWRIICTEGCERFSYYGLRGILTLYAVHLGYSESTAVSIFAYSSALAYMFPLLGGYVADAHLGKYRTILYFCLIYCCGSGILSLSAVPEWKWAMFLGLVFIGIGTGGIKPNVSAFGGDQLPTQQASLISSYFHYFYFAINVGSVSSLILTPILRHYCGFAIAFGVPFLLLSCAVLIFVSGKRHYKMNPPEGSVLTTIIEVVKCAWSNRGTNSAHQHDEDSNTFDDDHWLDKAVPTFSREIVSDVKQLWNTLPIFASLPLFWALFDQQGSSWTLQAKEMDMSVGTIELQPEQLQVLNPVLILSLIPVFERYVYPWCRQRFSFGALNRMIVGMVLATLAFVASALVQLKIDASPEHSVSVFWQVPQYALISAGEILISITGLDFAYQQAPPSMKSMVQSLFLLTTALGDLMTGAIYNIFSMLERAEILFVFAFLMFLNIGLFAYVKSNFRGTEDGAITSVEDVDLYGEEDQLIGNNEGPSSESITTD